MAGVDRLSWRTHPFGRQRARGLLALLVVLVSLFLVHLWADSVLLTVLGGLLFLLALWPFYFPVRFQLRESGVEIDYGLWRRRWPWERFQVFEALPAAFLLSPFRQPCRLERFRGLVLPCPEDADTEAVAELLARHLAPRQAAVTGGGDER